VDSATFAFYLGKTPAEYAAAGPVDLERVTEDLHTRNAPRTQDMALAFLAFQLKQTANDPGGAEILDKLRFLAGSDRALVLRLLDRLLHDAANEAAGHANT
jgi:hypothetical protein